MIAALATAAVGLSAGWYNTHAVAWSSVWGVFTVAGVLLLTVLFKIYVTVAEMAESDAFEISALRNALATYNPADGDAEFRQALGYIQSELWEAKAFWEAPGAGIERLAHILDEIEHAAYRGRIQMWGRAAPASRHVAIPARFWEAGHINVQTTFLQSAWVLTTVVSSLAPSNYYDVWVNRAEIEREWPRTSDTIAQSH